MIGISQETLNKIRIEKAAKSGEFKKGFWVEWVELPVGSRLYDYCLANPETYKVIPIESQ